MIDIGVLGTTQMTTVGVKEIGGVTREVITEGKEDTLVVEKRSIVKKDLIVKRSSMMVTMEESEVDMMVPGAHMVRSKADSSLIGSSFTH